MRNFRYLAAAAAIVPMLGIGSAPAFAVVAAEGQSPAQVCAGQLQPNANSGFVTAPINLVTVTVSDTTTKVAVGDPSPLGEPTYGDIEFANLHVNGKSPNIHADAAYTTATYSSYSQEYDYTRVVVTKQTFDCKVWKTLKNGSQVVPPDQQTYGHETAPKTVTTQWTATETVNEPLVLEVNEPLGEMVVCNSPGPNGGTWTQQNGFTGECSDQAYEDAGGDLANLKPGGPSGGPSGGPGGGKPPKD